MPKLDVGAFLEVLDNLHQGSCSIIENVTLLTANGKKYTSFVFMGDTFEEPGENEDEVVSNRDDIWLIIDVAESGIDSVLREKIDEYSNSNISEYWIIDPADGVVHVFCEPHPEGYKSISRHNWDQPIEFPFHDSILVSDPFRTV